MIEKAYFSYWGKARKENQSGEPYHLLPYHCLDVAAVGNILLQTHRPIRHGLTKLTGLTDKALIRWSVFFLALHDIGKFTVSFQQLRPDLLAKLQHRKSHQEYTERHDYLGYEIWKKTLKALLQEKGLLTKGRQRAGLQAVDYWALAVTGHHGQPPTQKNAGFLLDDHFAKPEQDAVLEFAVDLIETLLGTNLQFPTMQKDQAKESSWWLAGFAVLCDWLGSNADYFPYQVEPIKLEDYWGIALDQARKAIDDTELLPATTSTHLTLVPWKSVPRTHGDESIQKGSIA